MTILDQEKPAHAAAEGRLQSEPIIWLTTVTPAGQPQSTPVWFLWQDGEFLIYGARNGLKNQSIEVNPHVSLHLEGNGRGGANVIFEATARIDPDGPRAGAVPDYVGKYREFIDANGWTPQSFSDDYPHVIRVTPTRARIDPDGPRAGAVPDYVGKYREFIDANGWTPQSFSDDYPHVIRVTPTRARIW